MVIYRYISDINVLCSIHCKRMSLMNVESYVFINVFYLDLFCTHVCVDDVIEKKSSISPLSPIDILYEEFTNLKTFVCQELNFINQELSHVKQNTNKSDRRNCNYETCHKNALDEKIVLLESNNSCMLHELHNKQIITEKLLANIPSNSDKVKTVKHLSESQKQKVQHQEKQQEKFLETVRQTIKETDPPEKVNRSNADNSKEPLKKL